MKVAGAHANSSQGKSWPLALGDSPGTPMPQLYNHVSDFLYISQQNLFTKSYTTFKMDTALKQATELIPAFDSIKDRYLSKMNTWC